jgi:hypothetical protein
VSIFPLDVAASVWFDPLVDKASAEGGSEMVLFVEVLTLVLIGATGVLVGVRRWIGFGFLPGPAAAELVVRTRFARWTGRSSTAWAKPDLSTDTVAQTLAMLCLGAAVKGDVRRREIPARTVVHLPRAVHVRLGAARRREVARQATGLVERVVVRRGILPIGGEEATLIVSDEPSQGLPDLTTDWSEDRRNPPASRKVASHAQHPAHKMTPDAPMGSTRDAVRTSSFEATTSLDHTTAFDPKDASFTSDFTCGPTLVLERIGDETKIEFKASIVPYVLGRSNDADLVISAATVSRRHAELFYKRDFGWRIRGLSSARNPVLVDGYQVVPGSESPLEVGGIVSFATSSGELISFRRIS